MNHSEAVKLYHNKISDIASLIRSQKPEVIARAFIEVVDTIEFDLPDDYLFQELKKEIERITNKSYDTDNRNREIPIRYQVRVR